MPTMRGCTRAPAGRCLFPAGALCRLRRDLGRARLDGLVALSQRGGVETGAGCPDLLRPSGHPGDRQGPRVLAVGVKSTETQGSAVSYAASLDGCGVMSGSVTGLLI